MTTYNPYPADDADPKCDDCSAFDANGFALDGRAWVPVYGNQCTECFEDA